MSGVRKYGEAVAELHDAAQGRYAGPTVPAADLERVADGLAGLNTPEIARHMGLAVGSTDTGGLSKGWLGGLLQLLKHLAFGLIGETVAEGIRGWWRSRDEAKNLDADAGQAAGALDDIARTSETAMMEILSALSQSVTALSTHLRCIDPHASPEHREAFDSALGSATSLVDQAAQSVTQLCRERDEAVRECVAELERRAMSMCGEAPPSAPGCERETEVSRGRVPAEDACPAPDGRGEKNPSTNPAAAAPVVGPPEPQGARQGDFGESRPVPQGEPRVTPQCAPAEMAPAPAEKTEDTPEEMAAEKRKTVGQAQPPRTEASCGALKPENPCQELYSGDGDTPAGAPLCSTGVQTIAAQAAAAGIEAMKQGVGLAQHVVAGATEALDGILHPGGGETPAAVPEDECKQHQSQTEACHGLGSPASEQAVPEPTEPETAGSANPSQECPPASAPEPPPPEPDTPAPQPVAECPEGEARPSGIEDLASVPEPAPPAEKLAHMNQGGDPQSLASPAELAEPTEPTEVTEGTAAVPDNPEAGEAQESEAPNRSEESPIPPGTSRPGEARKAGAW